MTGALSTASMCRHARRFLNAIRACFFLSVNGQVFDLDLQPDRRDCRRRYAFRNSKPHLHAGLERSWHKVQSKIAPSTSSAL